MSKITVQIDTEAAKRYSVHGRSAFFEADDHGCVSLHNCTKLELGKWITLKGDGRSFQYRAIYAYNADGQSVSMTVYRDAPKRKPRSRK